MSDENKIHDVNEKLLAFINEGESYHSADGEESYFDELEDFDFSEFKGSFKSGLRKIHAKKNKRLSKEIGVKKGARLHGGQKKLSKVIVPRDKKVIVEGVSDFILDSSNDGIRNIGYYEGKKLKEMVLTFNNNSALDFNLELFNTSMPLDYLQSTSLNLNDKIEVAGGGGASYTDVLYNLLANPALLVNAKFTLAGPSVSGQINQPLIFKNKNVAGEQKIEPQQMQLNVDSMQYQSDIVYWDIRQTLGRAFIPDGMDVIQYKVLAGMTVTFAFYYKQKSLKKFFFKEAQRKGLY